MVAAFLTDALILMYFGFSKQTDAFFAALAIPRIVSGMIEAQSTRVFVPLFSRYMAEHNPQRMKTLISNFINLATLLLLALSTLAMAASFILIPLSVPGLDAETVSLCIRLNMILVWLIFFRGIGGILKSILFAYHHYAVTSSTKLVSSLITILIIFTLHRRIGIYAVAMGFLLGAFIQHIPLFIALFFKGFRYTLYIDHTEAQFYRALKLLLYPYLDHGLSQCRILLENFLTSFLDQGTLTALRYANRIIMAVTGILVASVGTATLPLLSAQVAASDSKQASASLTTALKLILFISVPVSIFLIFECEPILVLLLERGKLLRTDITLVSNLIALMVPYVLFSRISTILQIPFLANLDTRTPLLATFISFAVHLLLIYPLYIFFSIYGFPVAACLASVSASVAMAILLRVYFPEISLPSLPNFVAKLFITALLTVFAFYIGSLASHTFHLPYKTQNFVSLITPVVFGTPAFILSCFCTRLVTITHIRTLLQPRCHKDVKLA
jgi:putative peptidoglycan lipid II flippase